MEGSSNDGGENSYRVIKSKDKKELHLIAVLLFSVFYIPYLCVQFLFVNIDML